MADKTPTKMSLTELAQAAGKEVGGIKAPALKECYKRIVDLALADRTYHATDLPALAAFLMEQSQTMGDHYMQASHAITAMHERIVALEQALLDAEQATGFDDNGNE